LRRPLRARKGAEDLGLSHSTNTKADPESTRMGRAGVIGPLPTSALFTPPAQSAEISSAGTRSRGSSPVRGTQPAPAQYYHEPVVAAAKQHLVLGLQYLKPFQHHLAFKKITIPQLNGTDYHFYGLRQLDRVFCHNFEENCDVSLRSSIHKYSELTRFPRYLVMMIILHHY
jgi:hypothetical protein